MRPFKLLKTCTCIRIFEIGCSFPKARRKIQKSVVRVWIPKIASTFSLLVGALARSFTCSHVFSIKHPWISWKPVWGLQTAAQPPALRSHSLMACRLLSLKTSGLLPQSLRPCSFAAAELADFSACKPLASGWPRRVSRSVSNYVAWPCMLPCIGCSTMSYHSLILTCCLCSVGSSLRV